MHEGGIVSAGALLSGAHGLSGLAWGRQVVELREWNGFIGCRDLFGDDAAAYSKDAVRPGVLIRANHAAETTIGEFDRTVIFDCDSDATCRLNQISEGSSSRNVAGAAAVVRAMYSFDKTEPGDVDVFP